jgi:hypothetical protein
MRKQKLLGFISQVPVPHFVGLLAKAGALLESTTMLEVSVPAVHEVHTNPDHVEPASEEYSIAPAHSSSVRAFTWIALIGFV